MKNMGLPLNTVAGVGKGKASPRDVAASERDKMVPSTPSMYRSQMHQQLSYAASENGVLRHGASDLIGRRSTGHLATLSVFSLVFS